MLDLDFTFTNEVWLYSATKASWHFVTVPVEMSADIKAFTKHLVKGFRSVKVTATIGETTWSTSIFPDSKTGCYFLPIKASVRAAEGVSVGDQVTVQLVVGT